jgi:hypothetical protein
MRRTPSPDSAGFTLSAWVDESVIVGRDGRPGVYTLAAVVADSANCDDIRGRLRALTLSRGGRLHWVDESSKRRDVIAAAIACIDLAAIVTIGSPMDKTKQERARRCCLERLLYELGLLGVSQVWLESRSATPDRRDLKLVDSARDKGMIPTDLKVDFARPRMESMLWLPDAVAGAVTAANLGEPRWMLAMSEVLTQHEVDVR